MAYMEVFCESPQNSRAASGVTGITAIAGIIAVVGITADAGVTAVAEVTDFAVIIAVTGFSAVTTIHLLLQATCCDLYVVFATAVSPTVAWLLLLLASLEYCCCLYSCC
jgi:hypothetical protein